MESHGDCEQHQAWALSVTTVASVQTRSATDSPAHARSEVSYQDSSKARRPVVCCLSAYVGSARMSMERMLGCVELEKRRVYYSEHADRAKWEKEVTGQMREEWQALLQHLADHASSSPHGGQDAWDWLQGELQRSLAPASEGLAVPRKAGEDSCLTALRAHAAAVQQHVKCAVVLLERGTGQQAAHWTHLDAVGIEGGKRRELLDIQTQQVIEELTSGIDPVGWHRLAITFYLHGHTMLPDPVVLC